MGGRIVRAVQARAPLLRIGEREGAGAEVDRERKLRRAMIDAEGSRQVEGYEECKTASRGRLGVIRASYAMRSGSAQSVADMIERPDD
jgi:hypothetical protein